MFHFQPDFKDQIGHETHCIRLRLLHRLGNSARAGFTDFAELAVTGLVPGRCVAADITTTFSCCDCDVFVEYTGWRDILEQGKEPGGS